MNKTQPDKQLNEPLTNIELMDINQSLTNMTLELTLLLLNGEKVIQLLLENVNENVKIGCQSIVKSYCYDVHDKINKGDFNKCENIKLHL